MKWLSKKDDSEKEREILKKKIKIQQEIIDLLQEENRILRQRTDRGYYQ